MSIAPAAPIEMTSQTEGEWTDRYLRLLGVRAAAPSLEHLTALIAAQFATVPFENVTSLTRRFDHPEGNVPDLDLDTLLANWEAQRGGGVCFEIVTMFHQLVRNLGYEARLILAQISFADGHQGLIVTLDGVDWLVDVGTGSPVFRPITLAGADALACAGVNFRFHGDETDPRYWLQERLIDGEWKRSCRYDLEPPTEERKVFAYQLHHTYGSSWVVDTLRMACWRNDVGYSISGNELTILRDGGKEKQVLTTPAEYRAAISNPASFNVPNLQMARIFELRPTFAPVSELSI